MLISIIIPCFNEKNTIEILIDKINNIKDVDKEIIIIDDCSTDGSREILKEKVLNKVQKIIYN